MNGNNQGFFVGDYRLNPEDQHLVGPDGDFELSDDTASVIEILAEHAGEPVRRKQIIDFVWHGDDNANRLLTRSVKSLRQKLKDSPQDPRYIETVPGYGYRLVAPVSDAVAATKAQTRDAEKKPKRFGLWQFMLELRQRKVCRAALTYALAVWLICQIAELIFEALYFPEWALPLIIVVGTLGFPIALILAWTFEVTPDGLAIDVPVANSAAAENSPRAARWNWALLAAGILISLQMLMYGFGSIETRSDSLERLRAAKTIVVTPFQATSVSLETKAYAFVLSEEVRHLLHNEYGLNVIYAELPSELNHDQRNADVLLQGSVSIAGGQVQVIVHLVCPLEGYDLWSDMIVIPDTGDPVSQHAAARAMLRALPLGNSAVSDDMDTVVAAADRYNP